MSPPVDPVRSDAALPARTDVLVIGGGIIGVSDGAVPRREGHAVAALREGRASAASSPAATGAGAAPWGATPREIPLALESLRLWRGMNARIGAETGFRQAGIVYVAETEAGTRRARRAGSTRRGRGRSMRACYAAEARGGDAGAARALGGRALHTPSDGRAEPQHAAPAIAEAARRRGATILTECAVRGVETEAGRVAAVVTEQGRIACDAVVLAGGAWSRLFCGNLGVDFPQLKVLGSVLRTAAARRRPGDRRRRRRLRVPQTARRRLHDRAARRRGDRDHARQLSAVLRLPAGVARPNWQGLRLRIGRRFIEEWRIPRRWSLDAASPFERCACSIRRPTRSSSTKPRRNLSRAFPAFAKMQVAERWGGLIDVTPDAVPVISPVDAVPGFYIASGFSGHGFGIGPGAGRLMADLVAGDAPVVDPTPFRLDRFAKKRSATR